jgi:hypothetical protein
MFLLLHDVITGTDPKEITHCCIGYCCVFIRCHSVKALLATFLQVSVLSGLFFDREGEGDMFLRKCGCFSTDYTALYLRR